MKNQTIAPVVSPLARLVSRPVQLELPLFESLPPRRRFLDFPLRDEDVTPVAARRSFVHDVRPLAA
jgi:hypothetical protein